MSWIRFFGLVVPVQITKGWLYILTTLGTGLFILLPLAILTYNEYYNSLVPNPSSPPIALNFTSTNLTHLSNLIPSLIEDFEFDPHLTYIFEFNLHLICPDRGGVQPQSTIRKIGYEIQDDLGTFHQGSYILDCSSHYTYSQHNDYIPYNLRTWVPPFLVSYSRSNPVSLSRFEIRGDKILEQIRDFRLQLTNVDYLIDDNLSCFKYVVKWTGFRYYLVKYYYICFILGTVLFAGISGFTSLATSYGLLALTAKNEEELERVYIKQERFE